MPYISPEVVEQARQIDLLTYLQSCEPQELVRISGNNYTTRTHDSLKISNGKWMWWSQRIGGYNALDYLVKVKGCSFAEAVETLMGKAAVMPSVTIKPKQKAEPKVLLLPEKSASTDIITEYLFGRGIDYTIIQYCIQEKLEQTKASSAHIGRFIKLIKKYKQPAELTKEMACELIDKIVVHEAEGKKPNRQQQVDIYYNFIGQFDLPLSEKEIAEARQKAEQEAAEKAKRKKNRQRESNVAHQAKAKAERWAANDGHKYPKRICEQCGKEFYPSSTRQRFCNTDCTKAHQQAEKEKKRFAEKGEHTFRQKVCKICGKPFWPSNGQEVLCSGECKTINRNQRQLAYYYRKQSGQKAGEAI